MPEYRVTFPRGAAGPAAYTAHAASREKAERAAAEEYRYESRGADPGTARTTPVYGPIVQD